MLLKNKLAIITGGTRGIGKSIVKEFAKEGAKVIFTYNKNDFLKEEVVKEVNNQGGFCEGFKIDVRDFSRILEWKEEIIEKYGKVDILVNNAGIIRDKALMMMTREDWGDVIDVNLNGLFNVTRSFIIHFMKQKSGNIINIASLSGIIGLPRQTNYAASKGGMISFTKALAKEVATFNIRVNAIAPGFINTDMVKELNGEYVKSALKNIPLARFGECEEVSKVASFLASEESSYITGEVIQVDGGLGM